MTKFLIALLTFSCFATHANERMSYNVNIDLASIKDDQIKIIVKPPKSENDYVEYHMAKIVPGTYSESNFGSFVNRFKAYDVSGSELSVERLSTNKWKIQNGGKLDQINYWVHDTYDRFDEYGKNVDDIIFEPNGTNFDKVHNAYIINTFGVVGYIDGMKEQPYELSIKH
ncbi:unnamed protein product, partial [Chrysoparadoxa australica]